MLYSEVSIVEMHTQANINWISDLIVKALCGACTILLGIAVNSLSSMNQEIKELSHSINALTISSTVVTEAQKTLIQRINKIEKDHDLLKNNLRDNSLRLGLIEKNSNLK